MRRDLIRHLRNSEADLGVASSQLGQARRMLWAEERAEADQVMGLIVGAKQRLAALRRSWEG